MMIGKFCKCHFSFVLPNFRRDNSMSSICEFFAHPFGTFKTHKQKKKRIKHFYCRENGWLSKCVYFIAASFFLGCCFQVVRGHIYRIKIDDTFSTNLFTVLFLLLKLGQDEMAIKNRLPICLSTLSHTWQKFCLLRFYDASLLIVGACVVFAIMKIKCAETVIRLSDKMKTFLLSQSQSSCFATFSGQIILMNSLCQWTWLHYQWLLLNDLCTLSRLNGERFSIFDSTFN